MSKWIHFNPVDVHGRKTSIWMVYANGSHAYLGDIKWFGRWRCYAFFPYKETVFEKQCLRDIAEFCDERTNEHRAKGRAPR